MEKIAGLDENTWGEVPQTYKYKLLEDLNNDQQDDYVGQTFLEKFGDIKALGFTMAGINPTFLENNPGLNTPDLIAQSLWNSGNNGTFTIHAGDTSSDLHSGFGDIPAGVFLRSELEDANGVGYTMSQVYSCSGHTIGESDNYRRAILNGNTFKLFFKKTDP